MFLRHWKEDGKAMVIENVNRLMFNAELKLQYRTFNDGRFQWFSIRFGYDYLQFTFTED